MKLQEAYNFFESLKNETTNKSEIKLYDKFIHVLSELKSREFSVSEIQSIEAELESLNLESNIENRKKYFGNALSQFEKFLKDTFALTSKMYYTNLGIGLGTTFGILFGIVFLSGFERSLSIALGLSVGMMLGLVIGRSLDAKAISAGKAI
jgi:hypothetical protein